jgi:hypothetical protein
MLQINPLRQPSKPWFPGSCRLFDGLKCRDISSNASHSCMPGAKFLQTAQNVEDSDHY